MNSFVSSHPARPRSASANLLAFVLTPLDAWSRRRSIVCACVLAALVGAIGAKAWHSSDLSGVQASRAALADATRRMSHAQQIERELPALRMRTGAGANHLGDWSAADALDAAAKLASESGLRVSSIVPVTVHAPVAVKLSATSEPPPIDHPLRLRADGSFIEIRRFLDALAGLPHLAVPENAQIRRAASGGSGLTLDATLRIFEALPGFGNPAPSRAAVARSDPFDARGDSATADVLLVGTLLAHRHALAMVRTPDGAEGFEAGQSIGHERVARVHPRFVELTRDGARGSVARTIAFDEESS